MEANKRGVVSFPKCGRTWIRLFLHYYWVFSGIDYKRLHTVFRHDNKVYFKKQVLLIRHPCDVMVSFYFHNTLRKKAKVSMDQFIRSKRNGIYAYSQSYTEWSEREDHIVMRYEDMFQPGTWRAMLFFFGIPLFEDTFNQCIQKTKFNTVRQNLEEIATFPSAWRYLGASHGNWSQVEPKDPEAHKFRRGKVGGYVDYLSQDQIDYILDKFSLGEPLEAYRQQYLLESRNYHA